MIVNTFLFFQAIFFISVASFRKNAVPILLLFDLIFSRFHRIFHRFILHLYHSTDHQASCSRKEKWSQGIDENDGIAALDELVLSLFGCHWFSTYQLDHYRGHDQGTLERQ